MNHHMFVYCMCVVMYALHGIYRVAGMFVRMCCRTRRISPGGGKNDDDDGGGGFGNDKK